MYSLTTHGSMRFGRLFGLCIGPGREGRSTIGAESIQFIPPAAEGSGRRHELTRQAAWAAFLRRRENTAAAPAPNSRTIDGSGTWVPEVEPVDPPEVDEHLWHPEVPPLVELEVDELVELEVEELVELDVDELLDVLEVMLPEDEVLVETLPELDDVVVLVIVPELDEVEVEVELALTSMSMSIPLLVEPEVVVVVVRLTLPLLLPPTNPPKKPPKPPPQPLDPPMTIGVLLPPPQQVIAGAGCCCGIGIGIGTIAYSCSGSGGITRAIRGSGRRGTGRDCDLTDLTGCALTDL